MVAATPTEMIASGGVLDGRSHTHDLHVVLLNSGGAQVVVKVAVGVR
jgi:hypothetical protein